jgi:glycosyltransferase involved in cell wall biosynthesis
VLENCDAAMMPLVSILIPCYNAAPWVAATIESALAQSWSRCEIIVVDDGSRDESLAIARSFESRGVTVISQPNRGASAARNRALSHARGEFIQFLDADDILSRDKISLQIALLATSPARSVSSCRWVRFVESPQDADHVEQPNFHNLSGVEFLQLFYETGAMMQPAAWLCPRTLLDEAGPWDESLSLNDDGEYFARVILRASGIMFCRAATVFYRSALPQSLSRRRDAAAMASLYRASSSIITGLLTANASARTRAAAAYGWKWSAFELYPEAPALSRQAWRRCGELGGSLRPFPAGRRFHLISRWIGWRLAKRLRPTC